MDYLVSSDEAFASRSGKLEIAKLSGVPIISEKWIQESSVANGPLDPASYILGAQQVNVESKRKFMRISKRSNERKTSKIRQVRVFVSSTFKDMAAERDVLSKNSFLQLEEFCRARNVHFTYVDLRWGITPQESSSGRTISLCLEQVDQCRPYFVSFLGDRYGWAQNNDAPQDRLLAQSFDVAVERHPWLDKYRDRSVTELEILYGALLQDRNVTTTFPNPARCFFYLRDPAYLDSIANAADFREASASGREKLAQLKEQIRESYCKVKDYTQPIEMANELLNDLKAAIDEDFPLESLSRREKDREANIAFAENLASAELPQGEYFVKLESCVARKSEQPVVVTAPSGGGKGQLVASWFLDHHEPRGFQLIHFVGNNSRGHSFVRMMTRIMLELQLHFGWHSFPIPADLDDLVHEFSAWVSKTAAVAGKKGQVLLVLDGIDQLEESVSDLRWLPKKLPANFKIVLTCRIGPMLDLLRKRGSQVIEMEAFNEEEIDAYINDYLGRYSKKLTAQQKLRIIKSKIAPTNSPFFLKTLLNQLRLFATFENIESELTSYLTCTSIRDLFVKIIRQWEVEFNARPNLVCDALCFLLYAKRGLSEPELRQLLGVDAHQWAPLHLALLPHLIDRGGLLRYSHPYLRDAVSLLCVTSPEIANSYHSRLTQFFNAQSFQRAVQEVPFHLAQVGDVAALRRYLWDLRVLRLLYNSEDKPDLLKFWQLAFPNESDHNSRVKQIASGYVDACAAWADAELRDVSPQLRCDCLRAASGFLNELGAYSEAGQVLKRLLVLDSKINGEAHASVADDGVALAKIHIELGEFSDAWNCISTARRIREQVFGRSHVETAECVFVQGLVKKKIGRYADSRPLYEQALRLVEKVYGSSHPRIARYLDHLADTLRKLDFFDAATQLYKRSLEIISASLGDHSTASAEVLRNIGLIHKKQGNYNEAEKCYTDALEIMEQLYGTEHPKIGVFLNDLADVYRKRGSLDQAMQIYHRSRAMSETMLGARHPEVAEVLNSMGLVEKKRSDYAKAEEYYTEALSIIEETFSKSHPKYGAYLANLADSYRKRGEYKLAEQAYTQSLVILERQLGHDHLEVAETLNSLGVLYKKQGRFMEAQPLYERSIGIVASALGEDHFKHGIVLNNLADVYRKLKMNDKALEIYSKSREIISASLGADHIENADPLDGIGRVYSKTGEWKKSIAAFKQALAVVKASMGESFYKYGMILGNLGDTMRKMGDNKGSGPLLEKAVSILVNSLGREHPETGDVISYRGLWRKAVGDMPGARDDLATQLRIVEASVGQFHWKYEETKALLEQCLGESTRQASRHSTAPSSGRASRVSLAADGQVQMTWTPWGSVPLLHPEPRKKVKAAKQAQPQEKAARGSFWATIPFVN